LSLVAGQFLNMVAEFVRDDIGLGEVRSGGAKLGLHVLPEAEVQIDGLVGRAVERPHRGLAIAAARAGALFVKHDRWFAIAAQRLAPHIIDIGADDVDELAGFIFRRAADAFLRAGGAAGRLFAHDLGDLVWFHDRARNSRSGR
jgi:hypothetical protein